MKPNKRIVWLIISTILVNISLDRITKILAYTFLKGKTRLSFFYNTVILLYTENNGAFLSLGHNWNIYIKYFVLLIIPVIICMLTIWYCLTRENNRYRIILLMTIVSGGLSNLFDRLFYNFSVIDFMNFGINNIRTGILNVADLSVTLGVILLILFEVTNKPNIESTDKI